MELNSVAGLGVRWAHLASCLLVVGAFGALLLAGRSLQPTVLAWEARVTRCTRVALLAALATGAIVLAQQTALAEGRAGAALEATALARFALQTQGGLVWLARHGLLVLVAAFVVLAGRPRDGADWLAARGEPALLAGAALALLGVSGHAAAVEPGTARAIAVDGAHLLAAGLWFGGLAPLAALLVAASREMSHGAWCWKPLAERPERRGHRVLAVDLPGHGPRAEELLDEVGVVGHFLSGVRAVPEPWTAAAGALPTN